MQPIVRSFSVVFPQNSWGTSEGTAVSLLQIKMSGCCHRPTKPRLSVRWWISPGKVSSTKYAEVNTILRDKGGFVGFCLRFLLPAYCRRSTAVVTFCAATALRGIPVAVPDMPSFFSKNFLMKSHNRPSTLGISRCLRVNKSQLLFNWDSRFTTLHFTGTSLSFDRDNCADLFSACGDKKF